MWGPLIVLCSDSAQPPGRPHPAWLREGRERPKTLVSGQGIFAPAELCSLGGLGSVPPELEGLAWSWHFSGVTVEIQEPEEAASRREAEKGRGSVSP